MPHQIIEYSANLSNSLDIRALVRAMHATASGIEALPIAGLRTRAVCREVYEIADGHVDNAFIAVYLRILQGRPLAVQQAVGEALFATLTEVVADIYESRPLALSFEIQEINLDTRWKRGNIREYMAQRKTGNNDV